MRPEREDELPRAKEGDPGGLAAWPLTPPEFIEQKGVEAVVARVVGLDVDRRRERRQDLNRGDAAEAEVIETGGTRVHFRDPLRPGAHPRATYPASDSL